ncbi:MAG: hypothetical protein OER86_07715, partial [Phycisphaerae bacterium]|nr:hypothetical protein [Phycisphaerae bacterium]
AIVGMIVLILVGVWHHTRRPSREFVCGTRMAGIYKAWYVWSETSKQRFATYPYPHGRRSSAPFGFKGHLVNEKATVQTRPELQYNVTATLWATVKIGETSAKQFICPSDPDAYIDPQLTTGGTPIAWEDESWDFTAVKGKTGAPLSFSAIDMYDPTVAINWNPNVGADWVFMADDNNNDGSTAKGAGIHNTTVDDLDSGKITQAEVEARENSSHHRGEGQNVLFGDGHGTFETTPFVGPKGDNIYAVGPLTASANVPKLTASPTHDRKDVYLVPITGNVGGSATLHPYD